MSHLIIRGGNFMEEVLKWRCKSWSGMPHTDSFRTGFRPRVQLHNQIKDLGALRPSSLQAPSQVTKCTFFRPASSRPTFDLIRLDQAMMQAREQTIKSSKNCVRCPRFLLISYIPITFMQNDKMVLS
ncbi:hypothetical protein PGT21_006536 [Puccinia graminis f. sp. tritici]|uniref:Uncharacterized protein n=1 Tax=Puccinia graminis f. sp. tritici TaxID=56615 RepID=A0A5B0M3S8_PUCGR|nr:hypothetical protein PGT21_006536 [Puccinia graminis f. sp. tritici]